jgi:hypothetical protein
MSQICHLPEKDKYIFQLKCMSFFVRFSLLYKVTAYEELSIIVKKINYMSTCTTNLRSGQRPVAGSCEYGDEPVGSDATELVN